MRIRTVKPEFWQDEKVGALSWGARLLFLSSWNFADDLGRVRWTPQFFRGTTFVFDAVDLAQVAGFMRELEGEALVEPYRVNDETYAEIRNFGKHQKIYRPGGRRNPEPPSDDLEATKPVKSGPDSSQAEKIQKGTGNREQGAGNGEQGTGSASDEASEPSASESQLLFEAFYEFWTGLSWTKGATLTKSQRGRINQAVTEALEADIDAAQIRERGKVYRREWGSLERTPQALLANWHRFTEQEARCEHVWITTIGGGEEYQRCRKCHAKEAK